MRKLFIALVSFLAGMILWGKPLYDLKPLKVAEGITCSIGDLNPPTKANKGNVNNSCWIDICDGLVIVDPGPTYAFAKEFAELVTKQTGKPVKAVVVTNYHDDRLYGASYYAAKQIPVIAHKSIVRDINQNYALASTPSVSIIGGMGDTSKASTHPPGAPTFWLCTPSHRASTHLALSTA
ncbi:MBL fold metallo-hydrolase [Nitratifractor sp.]